MSFDLMIYLKRSAMPSRAVWQKAINDAKFPVELDHDFDADTLKGFLPCRLRGAVSGMECRSSKLTEEDREECGAPESADFEIALTAHDSRELACAIAVGSALCKIANGELCDPQSGDSFAADTVLKWAAEQFAEAERESR